MIHLKRMIDVAKMSNAKLGDTDLDVFFQIIGEVRPFVFTSDPEKPEQFAWENFSPDEELDLPFPVCSFEDINWRKTLTSIPKGTKFEDAIKSGNAADGFNFNDSIIPPLRVSCFLVREVAPKEYDFWLYDSYEDFVLRTSKGEVYYDEAMFMVKEFLKKLKKQEVGEAKVKERVKLGKKAKRREIKIRKIIYVSSNENKKHANRGDINWDYSHRWEVRGHWRTLAENKIGKNRDGDYCIKGYTWVKDHVKGPEDAPLVADKTRVVK